MSPRCFAFKTSIRLLSRWEIISIVLCSWKNFLIISLVQVYIPSMLIVILSFVSFWIDHKSVGIDFKQWTSIDLILIFLRFPHRFQLEYPLDFLLFLLSLRKVQVKFISSIDIKVIFIFKAFDHNYRVSLISKPLMFGCRLV